MESWLFLGLIIILALVAHNNSLLWATIIVMCLKLLGPLTQTIMETIHSKGIHWGITFITIAMLIPIATGEIGFSELVDSFKTPLGWIAVICGILVAIFSSKGVHFIAGQPSITVALVIGTIIGIVIFKGMAAGPIIAAGMTYVIFNMFQMLLGR